MPETVQPLVSVLIPTYNQREYIVKAIESALQQDYEPLEVIVGDDCSSDGTKALVMSTFSDTRLKYFRNEVNIGRVANYRATLSRATGDWAINLDGDDYFTNPSYIRKAVDRARTREDIALVFGRRYTDSEGRVDPDARAGRNEKLRDVMDGNEVFLALADYSIVINHMTCLYRRELAVSLSFYRLDIISADWESIYRMVIGRKVGFIDEYCGAWRRHGANASRSFNERGILNNYQLCTSLRDAAAGSGLFSLRQLSKWLARFTATKLRRDCLLAARFGPVGAFFRLLARGWSISPSGCIATIFTAMPIRVAARYILRAFSRRNAGIAS